MGNCEGLATHTLPCSPEPNVLKIYCCILRIGNLILKTNGACTLVSGSCSKKIRECVPYSGDVWGGTPEDLNVLEK